ncbi:hypothetical protein MKX01_013900 [Papaver californicum]|nr:hypothetical protein MKX01_013900 [Papaver californicum]
MGREIKAEVMVPEHVLKKNKRVEEWTLAEKTSQEVQKKKNSENRKLVYKRERELIRLKREAKLKGGFYVNPKAKLLIIVRIRGINAMDPKTKKILYFLLFAFLQIFNGVFLKMNKATLQMLQRVGPYVCIFPPLQSHSLNVQAIITWGLLRSRKTIMSHLLTIYMMKHDLFTSALEHGLSPLLRQQLGLGESCEHYVPLYRAKLWFV